MTGAQKDPSKNTRHCDKCGRDINARGFNKHTECCNGDPDRPLIASERVKYDREHIPGTARKYEPKKTPEPKVHSTPEPDPEPELLNGVEVHTTVPLNPSTNEHGGIVKQDPELEQDYEDDDGDDDAWDGYLC